MEYKNHMSYESAPEFWRLLFLIIPCVSTDGKTKGDRISIVDFKVLLWRYYHNMTYEEVGRILGKKVVSRECIEQREKRALKVLRLLFKNKYSQI